jgi:hypothetical protein
MAQEHADAQGEKAGPNDPQRDALGPFPALRVPVPRESAATPAATSSRIYGAELGKWVTRRLRFCQVGLGTLVRKDEV